MSSTSRLDFIMESKLFAGFSAEECILVEQNLKPFEKFYQKNEIVYDEDDRIKWIGQILWGKLVGEKFNLDGKAHLVNTFGKKDIIGLETIYSSKERSPISYTAAENTMVLMFPHEVPDEQGQIPSELRLKMQSNIIRILADENIKSLYKLEVLSKRALRCRVRTFLCIMAKKSGGNTFHIGMDREQFAHYLCVNRSALSYELGQMQKDGLIEFHKDLFTILDEKNFFRSSAQ
ncbi:MAG: hypothetical protein K0Q48_439 [Bacillota bacterium]|jgi:CRP-like cAMP-binding protein|nr:hypothetical protein [Bacillota bacterium]